MIENVKEMIILYAPTVLCAASSVIGFFKTAKQLSKNAKDISESAEMSNLKKEIKSLREQLQCQNKLNYEIMEQNKEILKNDKADEEIQENV